MSQSAIFLVGTGVFFLGGLGLVLVGLDAFRSWAGAEEGTGEWAVRAAELARAGVRAASTHDRDAR